MKQIDLVALLVLLLSWLSINAVWGMTGPETLISGLLSDHEMIKEIMILGPLSILVVILFAGSMRNKKMIIFGLMVLAYVLGVILSRYIKEAVAWQNIFLNRSLILIPAIPMLALAYVSREHTQYPLKIGDWNQRCEIGILRSKHWKRALAVTVLLIVIPSFLLFQAGVEFELFKTGRTWTWLPTIVGMSLLNGFSEELLFRGLLMVPLIGLLGIRKGIWFQALYFGFHHFGASPDLIAGLPMAIILTLLGVLFGRSVWETKGLSWAIALHVLLDISSLSAHLPL